MFFRKRIAELEKMVAQLQRELHYRDKKEEKRWAVEQPPKRNKWKKIPSPFTGYQIRKDKKVRNTKTGHILTPTKGNNGALYYTLNKDDGSKASVKLNTLLEITYGNKKYKSRKKHYKLGQLSF